MKLDWLLLANYAEVNNGLLYISGGGWDTVTVQAPLEGAPANVFAVIQGTLIARVLFHPTETGRQHDFQMTILDEDGGEIGRVEGNMRVERQPGLPGSWMQPVNIPIPLTGVGLPHPGHYTISFQVNGQHVGDRPFRVIKGY